MLTSEQFWVAFLAGFVIGPCLMMTALLWRADQEPEKKPTPRERLVDAAPDLLNACELFEKWMLGGQPGPYSDSQILRIVQDVIRRAKP